MIKRIASLLLGLLIVSCSEGSKPIIVDDNFAAVFGVDTDKYKIKNSLTQEDLLYINGLNSFFLSPQLLEDALLSELGDTVLYTYPSTSRNGVKVINVDYLPILSKLEDNHGWVKEKTIVINDAKDRVEGYQIVGTNDALTNVEKYKGMFDFVLLLNSTDYLSILKAFEEKVFVILNGHEILINKKNNIDGIIKIKIGDVVNYFEKEGSLTPILFTK